MTIANNFYGMYFGAKLF